ncbi:MAG: 23S rRNA (adenine(2030)-N(6))-methyltransferase RlmJ [Gammaproteobacteria bacterium]
MNYRHDDHVGNHADVFKHFAWTLLIGSLKASGQALDVLDTHAGAGKYLLPSGFGGSVSPPHGPWASGLGRLLTASDATGAVASFRALLADHVNAAPPFYAGSPVLSAALCGDGDRIVLVERDSATRARLGRALAGDTRVHVAAGDGFEQAARASCAGRVGVTLVDPPYHADPEIDQVEALCEVSPRGGVGDTGVLMVWYPLMAGRRVPVFPPGMRAELRVRRSGGLFGSGLWWRGGPDRFTAALQRALPALARALAQDEAAVSRLLSHPAAVSS